MLVDSVRDCYAALGALHARWNPVPGRFKDYIAMPKFNMYQSLHTTVIGPEGKPVEIQIRTHTMHRRAEYGVAAHWKYKERHRRRRRAPDGETGRERHGVAAPAARLAAETADPGEFLDSLRFEINAREVYVFTPKGEVVALPAGATPVDFAYAVHTEVGHHCIGGRVNGRLVPLESRWRTATSSRCSPPRPTAPGPSRDWLHVRQEPAGPQQDPAVVLQGAPRGGDRARQGRHRQGDAQAGPAAPAADVARDADRRSPAELRYPDIDAPVRRGGRGARVRPARRAAGSSQSLGGEEGASEDLAEATMPDPAPRRPRTGDPGVVVVGIDRRLGQAGPVLHAGARATRSSASSPAAAASRCTAPTAPTPQPC